MGNAPCEVPGSRWRHGVDEPSASNDRARKRGLHANFLQARPLPALLWCKDSWQFYSGIRGLQESL